MKIDTGKIDTGKIDTGKIDTGQQVGGRGDHTAHFSTQVDHRFRARPMGQHIVQPGLQLLALVLQLARAIKQPGFDLAELKLDSGIVGGPHQGGVHSAAQLLTGVHGPLILAPMDAVTQGSSPVASDKIL